MWRISHVTDGDVQSRIMRDREICGRIANRVKFPQIKTPLGVSFRLESLFQMNRLFLGKHFCSLPMEKFRQLTNDLKPHRFLCIAFSKAVLFQKTCCSLECHLGKTSANRLCLLWEFTCCISIEPLTEWGSLWPFLWW